MRIALVGSPNSGKTTLFNALTGLRQKVANYPGVTVDHAEGKLQVDESSIELIDIPGLYSLKSLSPDEDVARSIFFGEAEGIQRPDAILIVADATTLERSLQLVGEILAEGRPAILAVTMIDEMKARKGVVNIGELRRALGIQVIGIVGNKGIGIDDLKHALANPKPWIHKVAKIPETTKGRFEWADRIYKKAVVSPENKNTLTDKIDKFVLHPVLGIFIFAMIMFTFFQVIFVVAAPIQEFFEWMVLRFGVFVKTILPAGLFSKLIVEGLIAGVGGVVVFIPQIALLMAMVAIMEATGYMARAAFLIDRVMGWAGLEGRSFISLLSSFACAIPGIMAARAIPDPKSRLATIMVAPFMTCSARLPVYGLLIGAFIPSTYVFGFLSLQALVLFALYLLGAIAALVAGLIFKRGLLRGATFPFYMELPPYRRPSAKNLYHRVGKGVWAFTRKAGTVILVASVLLWGLLNFPQVEKDSGLNQVEQSYAADIGQAIEPVLKPIGFDWKIGIGLIASLAAREVIVSTMAQIYRFEGKEDDIVGLGKRLQQAKRKDGSPAYPLPTVFSLLVFFVFALQCVSTLAIIRRETASWKWPAIAFSYMLFVAYVASFITYRVSSWWIS